MRSVKYALMPCTPGLSSRYWRKSLGNALNSSLPPQVAHWGRRYALSALNSPITGSCLLAGWSKASESQHGKACLWQPWEKCSTSTNEGGERRYGFPMWSQTRLHISDLHQQLIVCSLACMASVVSIVSGVMEQNEGYQNLFVAELPFDIAGLLASFFLVPETQFVRLTSLTSSAESSRPDISKEEKATPQNIETTVHTRHPVITRMSYLQSLAPWSGVSYTDKSIPHLLARVFVHLINPAVFWIMMVSAVLVSTFVATAYITSQILSVPPYNLNVAQNGYFWVGSFIGGLLAVVAGPLCDWSAQAMSKLNKGVFEAEFRIPVNILGGFFCGLGWFLFMWVVDHPTPNGYLLGSFCLGCVCFGISVPSTSAGLYIL